VLSNCTRFMIKRASEKESVDAVLLWHFGTFVPLGNMTKRSSLDLAAFYSRHMSVPCHNITT